jgi:hypothetical protein
MKKFTKAYFIFFFLCAGKLSAIHSPPEDKIRQALVDNGFENIRVLAADGKYAVSIENNIYRWNIRAIAEALSLISGNLEESSVRIELLVLDNQIPQILIEVNSSDWENFTKGEIPGEELSTLLTVSNQVDEVWNKIKSINAQNTSNFKFDITLYPQLSIQNTLLEKIYEFRFNIAPAIDVSLAKGLTFTGQVIFPMYNELGYEGKFIRPGIVTISQDFRLSNQWFSRLVAGNFGSSQYGLAYNMKHKFRNKNWNADLRMGYTGSSHFLDYKWTHSELSRFTWSGSVSYYYPPYNLELKGGVAKYLYNDYGVFGSITRNLREVAIGIYAEGGSAYRNGGFYFSIPFPFSKRMKHKAVRINLPDYYDFTYNAGTENYYGQGFRTSPDKARVNNYDFIQHITNELLTFKFKK